MTEPEQERTEAAAGQPSGAPTPETEGRFQRTVVEARERKPEGARASIFEIDEVNVAYSGNPAVRDITFTIGMNEITALIGPSGCGKSTLLNILAGFETPTTGQVLMEGEPVRGPDPRRGVVFQQGALFTWMTVHDNVAFGPLAIGKSKAEADRIAAEFVAMVGLSAFAKRYPYELSGGMQQRVGIARGLVHDPELLLMDEPFAALDAMTRETMMDELQRIWMSTAKSVLFITHSIPEAVYLSDRIIVMGPRPGRVIETLTVDLPRPRGVETMAAPRFNALTTHLRNTFRALPQAATP